MSNDISEEVQGPPVHILRFSHTAPGSGLGLSFLYHSNCLTTFISGTVIFMHKLFLHNQQGEARFKEINGENYGSKHLP